MTPSGEKALPSADHSVGLAPLLAASVPRLTTNSYSLILSYSSMPANTSCTT